MQRLRLEASGGQKWPRMKSICKRGVEATSQRFIANFGTMLGAASGPKVVLKSDKDEEKERQNLSMIRK